MDEFGISTCLVGIGEAGESRLAEGFEDRESDAEMVPDSEIDADTRYVSTGEKFETAEFGSVDLVVVTGDVSDDDSVETAAHIGDSCDSDAVSVVLVAGEPAKAELQTLIQSFGTVVVIETGRWIQELLTDLFTLYTQSMMLHTDYAQISTNLKQGSVASVCRATGDREELDDVVESCSGAGDDVLVGYAEVGREFTVGDAEELEALLGNERVVGGQATLSDDTGIRLTLLKRASLV